MPGCDFLNKSFSVATSRGDAKDVCESCKVTISGPNFKKNGVRMCRECFDKSTPDKEMGEFQADNFMPYYDQQLGTKITSLRQKVRLLEKKGLHYSEDNPRTRELGKMAKEYLGSQGNRQLDPKAKKEFEKITQRTARRINYGR